MRRYARPLGMGHQSKSCRGSARACSVCRTLFKPHPRLGKRQQLCGAIECRKVYLRLHRRSYRRRNVQAENDYQEKRKQARVPGYWCDYRLNHPEYQERERANARLRLRRNRPSLQCSQRQLDIVQAPGSSKDLESSTCSQRQLDRFTKTGALEIGPTNDNQGVADEQKTNATELFLDRPGVNPFGALGAAVGLGTPDLRCPVCQLRSLRGESMGLQATDEYGGDRPGG